MLHQTKNILILLLLLPVFSYGQKRDYIIGLRFRHTVITYDTVSELMLLCDTSAYIGIDNPTYNHNVYWTKGYCIKASNSYYVTYLDRFKRPFGKNIVVWISKEY